MMQLIKKVILHSLKSITTAVYIILLGRKNNYVSSVIDDMILLNPRPRENFRFVLKS